MKLKDQREYILENIRKITGKSYQLSENTILAMAQVASLDNITRGNALCRQGVPDHRISFITKGVFRMFHVFDGMEKTMAFAREGDAFMSVSTYLAGQTAEFTLEALEDSRIITIPNEKFRELCDTTDLKEWFVHVLLGQIYALEQRYVWLGNLDAYSRYTKLIEIRSDIINRIPLKYVASYLGITQETLSRIRARYARDTQDYTFTDSASHPL